MIGGVLAGSVGIGAGISALKRRYNDPIKWNGNISFKRGGWLSPFVNGEAEARSDVVADYFITATYQFFGLGKSFKFGIPKPVLRSNTSADFSLKSPRAEGIGPAVLSEPLFLVDVKSLTSFSPANMQEATLAGLSMGQGVGSAYGFSDMDQFTGLSIGGVVAFSILESAYQQPGVSTPRP